MKQVLAGVLLLFLLQGAWAESATQARPLTPDKGRKAAASEAALLLGQAARTFASVDLTAAQQAATAAYRLAPSAEALYWLGRVAWARDHKLAGRDYLRRFLADPAREGAADAPEVQQAQRLLAEPAEAAGELRIIGERNALVLVDAQIAGTLPLALPLLLLPGPHKCTVESGPHRQEQQVTVPVARTLEIRFNAQTGTVLVGTPPALIAVIDLPAASVAEQQLVAQSVEERVRRAKLAPWRSELAPALTAESLQCSGILACQRQFAARHQLDYFLSISARKGASETEQLLTLTLLDSGVAELAAELEQPCAGCSGPLLLRRIEDALDKVFSDGLSRPRGALSVTSTPAGAQVLLGQQTLGQTPLRASLWIGAKELVLQQPGFQTERRQVLIGDGQEASLSVTLQPATAPPTAPPKPSLTAIPRGATGRTRLPRPRWRLALGGAVLGVGALTLGFGISGLAVSGQLTGSQDMVLRTGTVGGVLLGVGLAELAGGAALIAIPGRVFDQPTQP